MKNFFAAALVGCALLLSACAASAQDTPGADALQRETAMYETEQDPPEQQSSVQLQGTESGCEQPTEPALSDEPTVSQQHLDEATPSEIQEPSCDDSADALQPSSPSESAPAVPEEPDPAEMPPDQNPIQYSEPSAGQDLVPEPEFPEEVKPAFDINVWVAFARAYGTDLGLNYDATATACWDNPIIASDRSIYLERDIKSRLELYAADGITYFCVWAQPRADGRYDLYIGYA